MRKKHRTIRALATKAVEIADMAGELVGKAAKSGASFAVANLVPGRSGKAKTKGSRSSSSHHSAVGGVSAKAPKRRRAVRRARSDA